MRIGVLGCMAQRVKGEIARRAPHVDLVLGTSNFRSAVADLEDVSRRGGRIVRTDRRPDPEHLPDADREISVRPESATARSSRSCGAATTSARTASCRSRAAARSSRPLADVLDEVAPPRRRRRARGHVPRPEHQHVRERPPRRGGHLHAARGGREGRGHRPPALPHLEPLRHERGHDAALRRRAEGHALAPHPRAVGLGHRARAHEAHVHGRRATATSSRGPAGT